MRSFNLILFLTLILLGGCVPADGAEIPLITADQPPSPDIYENWPRYTIKELNLSVAYPPRWYVHENLKALQISPNSQPAWSSYADPSEPNDGPYFDLLYNLNRQMGETPLAEIENILKGYAEEIETLEPAAALGSRGDGVMAAYRFTAVDDGHVLLIGAVENPLPNSPQAVIGLTAVVKSDELAVMKPIFEGILLSTSQADQLPVQTSTTISRPDTPQNPADSVSPALLPGESLTASASQNACPVSDPEWIKPPDDSAVQGPPGYGYYYVNADRSLWASSWWTGQEDYPLRVSDGGVKVGWFRPAGAELEITGQGLDGQRSAFEAQVPCCYPTRFQATGLIFPAAGCWEITAKAEDKTLSFVVWVEP